MTNKIITDMVPAGLLTLEHPFNLTDNAAFRKLLRSSVPEGSMVPGILRSLPLILEAEVRRPPEPVVVYDDIGSFDNLKDYYPTVTDHFEKLMPTFADIRLDLVRQALIQAHVPDTSEKNVVDELAGWLAVIIDGMFTVMMVYLEPQYIGSAYDTGIVPVMLDLTERYVTRVQYKIGSRLLGTATVLAKDQIIPLLQRLLASDTLDEDLRQETIKMMSFVETMRRDREDAQRRKEDKC